VEGRGAEIVPAGAEIPGEPRRLHVALLALLLVQLLLVAVDQQHVFHGITSILSAPERQPAPVSSQGTRDLVLSGSNEIPR
jgi:hypothetical protein